MEASSKATDARIDWRSTLFASVPRLAATFHQRMPQTPKPTDLETWSLRRQFVIPLGVLILAAAALVSLSTAWLNGQLERRYVNQQFDRVHQQLSAANYPLHRSVLKQIREYTGLEVILLTPDGQSSATSLDESAAREILARVDLPSEPEQIGATQVQIDGVPSPTFVRSYPLSPHRQSENVERVLLLLPKSRLSEQRSALVWAPAVTGMASVLLMMLVTSWIATKLASRIRQLESCVERLSTKDYRSAPLPGPKDALYRLSERINMLARQLAVAHAVIARTERTRLVSLVASGMAHEIRNSITGASLLIESVAHGIDSEDMPELEMAVNELNRASTCVKRILASDPNTVLTNESDLTLRQISESLERTVGHHAQHQQIQFAVPQSDVDQVVTQGAAVLTCLINLVMNAIEAAGPGGVVDVQVAHRHDECGEHSQIVWQIWDDGPGPPDAIAAEITEPFVTSKREGVGLGLAMAKRVAMQLAGSLRWFRADQQTCFEFSIRSSASAATATVSPSGEIGRT